MVIFEGGFGTVSKNELDKADWSYTRGQDASQAARHTTHMVLGAASKHIPQRTLHCKKSSHPRFTHDLAQVVAEERDAEGTPAYEDAVKACSAAIIEGYNKYAAQAREILLNTRSGSKLWWNLSRELLSHKARVQNIPALKSKQGEWVHASCDKADLLAKAFSNKNILPDLERITIQQRKLRSLQLGDSAKTVEARDEQSGTEPDLLPASFLKFCAAQLALPILQLATLILDSGEWPDMWKEHWIVPLFKREAVYASQKLPRVHLTAQSSKVVERLILSL